MPFGFHFVEILFLAVVCGGTVALVVGVVAIVRLLMRDTIRHEVRQALAEQRDQHGEGQR
jgi:hypothetical protein